MQCVILCNASYSMQSKPHSSCCNCCSICGTSIDQKQGPLELDDLLIQGALCSRPGPYIGIQWCM